MAEIDRLIKRIAWIDLSFVERDWTPEWAIQAGIRCHLVGMSLWDASQFLDRDVGSQSELCGDPRVNSQSRSTASFDGQRGSTRG